MKISPKVSILALLGFCVIGPALGVTAPQTPCDQVQIPYDQIPLEPLGWIPGTKGVPIVLAAPGDPILEVRVGEPGLASDQLPLVCGGDYTAVVINGVAILTFAHDAPFYVEADLQSGLMLAGHVMVDCTSLSLPQHGVARQYPVAVPESDAVIVGYDVNDAAEVFDEFDGKRIHVASNGIAALGLVEAFIDNGGQPMDVTFFTHGGSGKLYLGGLGTGVPELDLSNVCLFGEVIKPFVTGKKITLVSCCVGSGAMGREFVCKLADSTCTKVSSATSGVVATASGRLLINCAPLFEKDSRPLVVEVEGDGDGSGNEVIPDPGVSLVFPLDTFSHSLPPMQRLLAAWGTYDARWDLDRDGIVGGADLALLMAHVGP